MKDEQASKAARRESQKARIGEQPAEQMREAASDDRLGAGEKTHRNNPRRERKDEPQKLGEPPEVEGLPEADVAPEPEPAPRSLFQTEREKEKEKCFEVSWACLKAARPQIRCLIITTP